MKRWEKMEAWLFDYFNGVPKAGAWFTSTELSESAGIPRNEASRWVRAYVDAQRRSNANTLYVLKREGRTSLARWSVGERTADVRMINQTLYEDIHVKVHRAWKKDLERIAARNERAARFAEAKMTAIVDGALVMIASILDAEDGEP